MLVGQKSELLKQIFCSSYYGIFIYFLLFVFEGKLILSKTMLVLGQCMWSPDTAVSPLLSDLQQPFYHLNFSSANLTEKWLNIGLKIYITSVGKESAANKRFFLKFGHRS